MIKNNNGNYEINIKTIPSDVYIMLSNEVKFHLPLDI